MVNWGELPDFIAVGLLSCAFASVSRRNRTPVSGLWLTAWIMIVIHFAAFMFLQAPGVWGSLAQMVGLSSLVWAGVLFMWASVPYREQRSSRWMLAAMLTSNTLYIGLAVFAPAGYWAFVPAAALFCVLPLSIMLVSIRRFNHLLRWAIVTLYTVLAIFLLAIQNQPGNGPDLALNGVLFTVYFGCCIHFCYMYRRATAGAFITIAGFLAWALVFVIAPLLQLNWPQVHLESEVWNLPKYVVAVGMILLLLEDQIEHNRHLALHDALTGLPNRRLFQDRLSSALERARRTETNAALLVIDLDRFKQVNDTLGHHVGDQLLQHVGSLFSGRVRRSDTVARTGGDEFSVVLEEPTSRNDALHVSDSLLQLLKEPLKIAGYEVQIGASIGVAVFPEDARTMEMLCIAADLRMYDSKHGSGGLGEQALPIAPGTVAAFKLQTEAS